jgi:hypothetical protein
LELPGKSRGPRGALSPFVTFATFGSNALQTFCKPWASVASEVEARRSQQPGGSELIKPADAQIPNRFPLCDLCYLLFKSPSNLL